MTGIKAFIFIFLTMTLGHAMMIMINKVGPRFQVWAKICGRTNAGRSY